MPSLSSSSQWDVDPVVRTLLDRINDPVVREALDRLVIELQAKHSTVYEMLNRMDTNKDGVLSRDEIYLGLRGMDVPLTAVELDSVMRAFDKDHNNMVDYLELYTVLTKHRVERMTAKMSTLASVSPIATSLPHSAGTLPVGPLPASSADIWDMDPVVQKLLDRINDPVVREALDRLVIELQAKHSTVYEMLNRMDTNKDGVLSRDEICDGLAEMGVRLRTTELDSVMRAFDKDHNNMVDYLELYTVLTKHRVETATQSGLTSAATLAANADLTCA